MTAYAHGIGTRADLPIPTSLALLGSAAAVLASFAVLLLLWRAPRLAGDTGGRPLPAPLRAVLEARVVRRVLQGLTLVLALGVLVVALLGPAEAQDNVAPWALYVTFWVGLVPASLLLGPVWRVLNPLRLLHRLLAVAAGAPPAADRLARLGYWPAALSLLAFVWLELVHPDRTEPATVAVFLVGYGVVQLLASLWFGEGWFARGDGFEVYSTLLGRLSPLRRRQDGRLVVGNPLRNAAALPAEPGLAAVVVVLVGSTAFDGLTRTLWWATGPGAANAVLPGTLGLLGAIALVGLLYLAGTRPLGRLGGEGAGTRPGAFAPSIVPIAAGYAFAHYFSLLLFDGQRTWILASNPFARSGVDLLGRYDDAVDYGLVGTDTIALVQVGAIVLGHVVGVVLAHDRALDGPAGRRAAAQLPLLGVMVVLTVTGLALLFTG